MTHFYHGAQTHTRNYHSPTVNDNVLVPETISPKLCIGSVFEPEIHWTDIKIRPRSRWIEVPRQWGSIKNASDDENEDDWRNNTMEMRWSETSLIRMRLTRPIRRQLLTSWGTHGLWLEQLLVEHAFMGSNSATAAGYLVKLNDWISFLSAKTLSLMEGFEPLGWWFNILANVHLSLLLARLEILFQLSN